jgi:hypothetical protein
MNFFRIANDKWLAKEDTAAHLHDKHNIGIRDCIPRFGVVIYFLPKHTRTHTHIHTHMHTQTHTHTPTRTYSQAVLGYSMTGVEL